MTWRGLGLCGAAGIAIVASSIFGAEAVAARQAPAVTICANEQYQWFGQTSVGSGDSFHTGVMIEEILGTQLQVRAADYSTNDGVTQSISITVGGVPAVAGAFVTGGEIAAVNSGLEPVALTVVAVSVDRCHQVESAAPLPATRVSAPTASEPSTVPPPTSAIASGATLPSTGGTSIGLVIVAWCLVTFGSFLWSLSRIERRPAAATDRDRAT